MRVVLAVVFAWYWTLTASGGESKGRVSSGPMAIREYVSLRGWAETNQFQYSRKDEEVKLTNQGIRLTFKMNTSRVDINGISVFLAFPVSARQGEPWIAGADIDLTLRPILFPTKNRKGSQIKVIAISAGHGGKDAGFLIEREAEKKFTLLLAKELQKLCTQAGLKTVAIRDADVFLEREERPRQAKRGKAELYVELHYNCAGPGNRESRGVEVYCLTPDGANSTNGGSDSYPAPLPGNRNNERNVLLAYQIQRALVERVNLVDRGVRRARFEVLREAEMPAVLVEAGFMSQPDELRNIQNASHRRQTAEAILQGVLAYQRLVER